MKAFLISGLLFLAWIGVPEKIFAQNESEEKTSVKILRVVAPYLPENVEQNGKSGRDLEVFSNITNCMGFQVQVDVHPYVRHLKSYLSNNDYDAITTIPVTDKTIHHKTQNYISYNNGVIVRSQDFPNGVRSIQDLKDKHIFAFTGAKTLLKGVSENLKSFASYNESSTQFLHNEMLIKKRVDGVFSDGLIFMAHQRRLIDKEPEMKDTKVKFYSLFSLSHFSAAFRNPSLVPDFNECLSKLKKNGTLEKIEKRYGLKYDESLGDEYLNPLLENLRK